MIVQVINMNAPEGKQKRLRQLITQEYIPAFANFPGFLSADIQPSRQNNDVNVLLFWQCKEDLETFQKAGWLAGAALQMAAHLPGLRVRQRGVMTGSTIDSGT